MIERWRNDNGTYNGAKMLSDLSGRPVDEVLWIAKRVKELMADGKAKPDIMATINEEAKSEPWK